jgi:hypothetical protein
MTSGLHRSGRGNGLAAGPRASVRLPALGAADSVRLTLAADRGPLLVAATRGARTVRAVVGPQPVVLDVASELSVDAAGEIALMIEAAPLDAEYEIQAIVVRRHGPLVYLPALLPVAGALLVHVSLRRIGGSRTARWAVATFAVVTALAVLLDPLKSRGFSRASQERGLAAVVLALAVAAGGEPGVRRHWTAGARWTTTGGLTVPKVVLLVGAALDVGVVLHTRGLNGPRYWAWPWQDLEARLVFPAIALASAPFFVARALRARGYIGMTCALALVSTAMAVAATVALALQPGGLDRLHAAIESPGITAYYTDAESLAAPGWLSTLPERLWRLHVHSRTKPPGPLVFYAALIRVFGRGGIAATAGALLLLLAAGAAVPGVYVLARQLSATREAAFEAACLMAWSPSLLLFFPEMDQAFPVVTCAALVAWCRAVEGRWPWAAVFGLIAAGASFFSYSFLVLGVSGLLIARKAPLAAARSAAVAALVVVGVYLALYAGTGFDPVATFQAATANQARLAITWGRQYVPAVLHDPLDFAMGVGWITAALAVVALARAVRSREWRGAAVTSALQIGIVDLTGLLRVEAARVWLLLTPLTVVPAGTALAEWSDGERTACYVLLVVSVAVLAQNMAFIDLGPP